MWLLLRGAILILTLFTPNMGAVTLDNGQWKVQIDGDKGYVEYGGRRVIEKIEIILADGRWKGLFPTGATEWKCLTNPTGLTLATDGPTGPFRMQIVFGPQRVDLTLAFALPVHPELRNFVWDFFLAKEIFMGKEASLDGKKTLMLDATNRIGSLALKEFAAITPDGVWRLTASSKRGQTWNLRSSCEVSWRPAAQKTFDLIYQGPSSIGTQAFSEELTVSLVREGKGEIAPGALRFTQLPPDFSALEIYRAPPPNLWSRGLSPFPDGSRVVFVGDSITHRGKWVGLLEDFYLTRYPDRKIRFINKGIGGESTPQVVKRFARDIAPANPTDVFVMLGMNDSEYGPLYRPDAPKIELENFRNGLESRFASNMASLIQFLTVSWPKGPRMVMASPTPYDENDQLGGKALVGKNESLRRLGRSVDQMATSNRLAFLDFHQTVQSLLQFETSRVPAFSLTADRVHPHEGGALVMAYFILKAQGVLPIVSSLALDAPRSAVIREQNCRVFAFSSQADALSFRVAANALPLPVNPAFSGGRRVVPFTEELNTEVLAISNLSPGRYQLLIDGSPVTQQDEKAWAHGVNLATLETPQLIQARGATALLLAARVLEEKLRDGMILESQMVQAGVNPDDPLATDAFLGTPSVKTRFAPYLAPWREARSNGFHWTQAMESNRIAARLLATPVTRNYRLEKI